MNKPTPEKNPEREAGGRISSSSSTAASSSTTTRTEWTPSTKSFISEGHWAPVIDALQPGDYLIIQFGHNDEKKEDSTRYAAPRTDYPREPRAVRCRGESEGRNTDPVHANRPTEVRRSAAGKLEPTHGEYPDGVRELAKTENVPLLDMEKLTRASRRVGRPGRLKRAVCLGEPGGEWPAFPCRASGRHASEPNGRDGGCEARRRRDQIERATACRPSEEGRIEANPTHKMRRRLESVVDGNLPNERRSVRVRSL